MTYSDFWYGEPQMTVAYRKAYYRRLENRNYEMWLQGLYNCRAVSVVVNNALASSKSKQIEYFEKPIDVLPKTEKQRRMEIEKERKKVVAFFNAFATNFNGKQGD